METKQAQANNPKRTPHKRLNFFAYLLAVGVLALFPFFASASETKSSVMGYYYPPESSTIVEGGYYTFTSGSNTSHYIMNDATWTDGGMYGDIYSGTVGASTIINGHSLGVGCNDGICDVTASDTWGSHSNGDNLFIAIFPYSSACRTYFQTGAGSCGGNYGIIRFKWGTAPPPPPPTTNTISVYYPKNSITLSSTTVDLRVNYANTGIYDVLGWEGYYENQNFSTAFNSTTTASSGWQNGIKKTVTLKTNTAVLWRAYLKNSASASSTIYTNFETFYTVNNPYPNAIGTTTMENTYGLATSTCSVLNISGCFQNAMIYLFAPSQNSFDLIIGLKDDVANKPPFGYFTTIKNAMGGLTASTSPAYTWTIPTTVVNLFAPIKTGVTWILWVLFGFWVIRTFGKLQI